MDLRLRWQRSGQGRTAAFACDDRSVPYFYIGNGNAGVSFWRAWSSSAVASVRSTAALFRRQFDVAQLLWCRVSTRARVTASFVVSGWVIQCEELASKTATPPTTTRCFHLSE